MNKGFNEKNGGITLIALVITIVVLLILAGVSFNAVVGNNGIVNRAQEASQKADTTDIREQIDMELLGIYAEKGYYTNADVITAVKKVIEADTGTEINVDVEQETVTTAKGNEVDISDLWVKIKITISQFPEDAETSCALLEVASVEGEGVYSMSAEEAEEEYENFMQEVVKMDETSKKELAKIVEIIWCNYFCNTEFSTFEEVLQYYYDCGWIEENSEESLFELVESMDTFIDNTVCDLINDMEGFYTYTVINPDGETSNSYIATENGTYTFTVKDFVTGKLYTKDVTVSNINQNLDFYVAASIDTICICLNDKTTDEPTTFSAAYIIYNGELVDLTSIIWTSDSGEFCLINSGNVYRALRERALIVNQSAFYGSTQSYVLIKDDVYYFGKVIVWEEEN